MFIESDQNFQIQNFSKQTRKNTHSSMIISRVFKSFLPGFMDHICHHLEYTVYIVLLMSFHSWLLACIGMTVAGIATISVSPMDRVTGNTAPEYSI